MTKKCCACKLVKPVADFPKNKSKKDGLATECRLCGTAKVKKHYLENRERVLLRMKEYRERTKDQRLQKEREYHNKNKTARNAARKARYEFNREKALAREVSRRYGISESDYAKQLAEQDGRCAICRLPERKLIGGRLCRLAVDHDHTTGSVRGLLCSSCNNGLGRFDDDATRLKAAADYINAHKKGLRMAKSSRAVAVI